MSEEIGEINHMNDKANTAGIGTDSDSILMNQHVKELLSILQDNCKGAKGFSTLIWHVAEMENYVKHAEKKIVDMKSQLNEIKEIQNHPLKSALRAAIKSLEKAVAETKERITQIKNSIIEGCKNAVKAFKENGASALGKLTSFFNIKEEMQALSESIDIGIKADEKAIAKIEAFADEYHSAGRAIKNMARVAIGKQPISTKKEAGKLAMTLIAPYKLHRFLMRCIKTSACNAIKSLDSLEAKAAARQEQREHNQKPSVMNQLQENLAAIEQTKGEKRVQERETVKGAEI